MQGPLRLAAAVLLAGLLAVWLVKPIGDPCPDLDRLPQGSSATSSPSFSPPLTRTCTYTAAGGVQATSRYVPWLDWIVLVLLAAVLGGVARMVSPGARRERPPREEHAPREQPVHAERARREEPVHAERARQEEAGRDERAQRVEPVRDDRAPRAQAAPRRQQRAARLPRSREQPMPPESDAPPPPRRDPAERDAADRERARRERAERARRDR